MDKLKNTRILALVGSIAIFLGIILPYFTITIFGFKRSVSLWGYWEGKIAMILLLTNVAYIFRDYVDKYVPQLFDKIPNGDKIRTANPKLAIIPVIAIALFGIYLLTEVQSSDYLKYGLGFYSLWLGIIALVAHTFICKVDVTKTVIAQENASVQAAIPDSPIMAQSVSNINTQEPVSYEQSIIGAQQSVQPQVQQPVAQPTVQPVQPQVQQSVVQPTVQSVQPQVKTCQACGNNVDVNAVVCPMCGNNI